MPGRFGIGEFGAGAEAWLEALHRMGQKLWQILPLGPTGYGNSPYQSFSSFAGNPLLISFDALVRDGILKPDDLALLPEFPDEQVAFGPVIEVRTAFLKLAAWRFINAVRRQPPAAPCVRRLLRTRTGLAR